ncbi:universal stress protein [Nitrosopumilus sp. K4]|uniref:universal stress protein n=1 Tax=Nitrosopumilus sp. K4 TaxID=2795383 RepID=UPI001BA766A1|nr:universal stress protein [Nitrosopumilus sp. K4]QUC64088.1 universal stress protein [Nitrosopumilus sp. K4]
MKQDIKQILLPYDGTKSSERAFRYALQLAKVHQAKLLTLTCIKDQAAFGFFKLESDKRKMEKQKKNAEKRIENLKKEAEKLEVPIKSKIVKCDVISKGIVDYAKKQDVDIITMSKTKHGTAAEKMYSESTVDKVFDNAPCTFVHVK